MELHKKLEPKGLNNMADKYQSESYFGKDHTCCSFRKNG